MALVRDETDSETRTCILVAAERLFREIGYLKTTVSDIAKSLKMSPANVYRFFDSKKSIYEGVARRLLGEAESVAEAIAAKSTRPDERLRELLVTISTMNAERLVGDSKIHEMVAIAMEEYWGVCEVYIDSVNRAIAKVIADGVQAGVFKVNDVDLAALNTFTAMSRFFHPQLIEQSDKMPGPTLDQLIDFILAALTSGALGMAAGHNDADNVARVQV